MVDQKSAREGKKKPLKKTGKTVEAKSTASRKGDETKSIPATVSIPEDLALKTPVATAAPERVEVKSNPVVSTLPPNVEGEEVFPLAESRGNQRPAAPFRQGDDYSILCHYDKNARQFMAEVLEFPELKCSGSSRDQVVKELHVKLEDYIEDNRHQANFPEAFYSKRYPEKLEVPLSQSLYRKLDLLSRHEKQPLERVVTELLSSAIDRRIDASKNSRSSQPQQQSQQHHGGGGQHRGNQHHRHNRGGGGRHNQAAMAGGDNFLEYVRNLEKGGGGWKKR